MSEAKAARGTLLQIGDGASPVQGFTTIAEIVGIESGPETDMIDVTNHSSPGGFMEFIGGLIDAGEVTFEVNYLPADGTQDGTTGLLADQLARTLRDFKLIFPDPATTTDLFTAIVKGFKKSAPVDSKLTASVTLQVTGVPTLP